MNDALEEYITIGVNCGRNVKRTCEEDTKDDKGKNPLKGDNFDGDLFNSQSYRLD